MKHTSSSSPSLSWNARPLLEVISGDSLYLRSEDREGRFYTSWSTTPSGQVHADDGQFMMCECVNGSHQVQRLSLCADHLPPDAGSLSFSAAGVSLSRVLGRGRRLGRTATTLLLQ